MAGQSRVPGSLPDVPASAEPPAGENGVTRASAASPAEPVSSFSGMVVPSEASCAVCTITFMDWSFGLPTA